jgi:CheY-like chemotaxis protein
MKINNRRLLVLDDEQDVIDAYKMVLSPEPSTVASSRDVSQKGKPSSPPLDVTYVNSGEEALQEIACSFSDGRPFAGGFFDVRLGEGIDGIETIKKAKDMDPNMSFVIVTAYQDRSIDDISEVFGKDFTGRWDFLDKPFAEMVIQQKACNMIANWNLRRLEAAYLKELIQIHEEEQVFRTVLQDIFERVVTRSKSALEKKPDKPVQDTLKQITHDIGSGCRALEEFMKSKRKAS